MTETSASRWAIAIHGGAGAMTPETMGAASAAEHEAALGVALDAGRHPALALDLLKVFDSQVAGGKRYDLATVGRRQAHATFHTSHATDRMAGITWAMDLTPLVQDSALSPEAYALGYLERLQTDVRDRIRRFA